MSRLEEILREGKPPGLGGSMGHLADDCADRAIPRALREMETGTTRRGTFGRYSSPRHIRPMGAKEIAKGAGWSTETLKKTWKI